MDNVNLTIYPPVIAKPYKHCKICSKICPTEVMEHFFQETSVERIWKSMLEF